MDRKATLSQPGIWVSTGLCILLAAGCKHEPAVPGCCDPSVVCFEQQILPILISNCAVPGCHNVPTDDNDDIQITSYESLMNSDIIELDDPFDSDFWEAITDDDPDDRMPRPPQNPLTQAQLDLIAEWLRQGARNTSCADADGPCELSNVTYAGAIVPLVQQRCLGCHSGGAPQGGLNFSQWSVLNGVAQDGRLAASIQHAPGGIPMPPSSAMLPDCRIQQFMLWIEDGAPNN